MTHYNDDPSFVRVSFFKPSGKWYTCEAVKWKGYDGYIFDEFEDSLRSHLNGRLAEMDAVCLEPYNKNSHPIQLKNGSWYK